MLCGPTDAFVYIPVPTKFYARVLGFVSSLNKDLNKTAMENSKETPKSSMDSSKETPKKSHKALAKKARKEKQPPHKVQPVDQSAANVEKVSEPFQITSASLRQEEEINLLRETEERSAKEIATLRSQISTGHHTVAQMENEQKDLRLQILELKNSLNTAQAAPVAPVVNVYNETPKAPPGVPVVNVYKAEQQVINHVIEQGHKKDSEAMPEILCAPARLAFKIPLPVVTDLLGERHSETLTALLRDAAKGVFRESDTEFLQGILQGVGERSMSKRLVKSRRTEYARLSDHLVSLLNEHSVALSKPVSEPLAILQG